MRYIIGPELLWLIFFMAARVLSGMNNGPEYKLDHFIEYCWVWVPLLVVLTFGLFWISTVEKNWLWLRIWLTCILMGHFVMEMVVKAFSEQGPGIGTAYIFGMVNIIILLIIGSVVVKIIL